MPVQMAKTLLASEDGVSYFSFGVLPRGWTGAKPYSPKCLEEEEVFWEVHTNLILSLNF